MLNISTFLLYLFGATVQGLVQTGHRINRHKLWIWGSGMVAALLHAYLLHQWIDVGSGQNLSILNMFSWVCWLIAILVLIASLFLPVIYLSLLVFPIAALSILLIDFMPDHIFIISMIDQPRQLLHVLLSAVTISVLIIAGLQALLLAIQEYQLRHRFILKFLHALPPLEVTESILFKMISLGFALLTLLIAISLYDFRQMLMEVLSKIILAIVVWMMFAWLLAGRYLWGWRSRKVIYISLMAIFLLIIIYVGSQLFLGP